MTNVIAMLAFDKADLPSAALIKAGIANESQS
jgi:hypothetical protein